jgi:hypothetical protein
MEQAMKEVSANRLERKHMTALVEASDLLRQIAGPGEPGELKKQAWGRALRKLQGANWTYNRVRDLWRQEPRARVSADELTELRQAAKRPEAGASDDLLARLECIEARLNQIDPDFHRAQIDSLRSSVRALGRSHTS